MYNVTMLSADSQEFITYLSNGIRPRSPHTSIAVAKAVSSRLPMPASKMENLSEYYNMSCLMEVRRLLSQLNEMVPLDTDTVLDYVRKFFMVRYYAIQPKENILCLKKESALQDFFGLSIAMDQHSIDVISENPVEITKIHNKTMQLFNELVPTINQPESAPSNGY
jgi:predicted RNA binding protein with dsRBD fold (UPF0201 family)